MSAHKHTKREGLAAALCTGPILVSWERLPHFNQRYETIGDWQFTGRLDGAQVLTIRTSILGCFESELLVFAHEFVEAMLCHSAGILAEEVDAFDMGPGADLEEPGNDPRAPYHSQHLLATVVEKQLCRNLGMNWDDHDFHCQRPVTAPSPALLGAGLVFSGSAAHCATYLATFGASPTVISGGLNFFPASG